MSERTSICATMADDSFGECEYEDSPGVAICEIDSSGPFLETVPVWMCLAAEFFRALRFRVDGLNVAVKSFKQSGVLC